MFSKWFGGGGGEGGAVAKPESELETVHVFSLATGLLYEAGWREPV